MADAEPVRGEPGPGMRALVPAIATSVPSVDDRDRRLGAEAQSAKQGPHGEPSPRRPLAAYDAFAYAAGARVRLPPVATPRARFADVLEWRRTRRAFGPLDAEALSALLWFTARTLETDASAPAGSRGVWEHRVTPSAGGRHPIDVWVSRAKSDWPSAEGNFAAYARGDAGRRTLWCYDPVCHALVAMKPADVAAQAELDSLPARVLEDGRGVENATVLWHAAQFGRTEAAYINPDTLVWRDAGCLVATTALVAAGLRLACCPLGATGEPYISRVAGATAGQVRGVGGCVIGREVAQSRMQL